MTSLPAGTVTFLFTDIEGSTRLAQQHGAAWSTVKARHHAILRAAIESPGGYVFQVIGDAFCAAFHIASDALRAALAAQRALHAEPWGDAVVRVRMGIHTGAATVRPEGDYDGYLTLVRVQRIMSAAYGGQVLLSQATAELLGEPLPESATLRDLGTHRLKDLTTPEHLHQLVAPDMPADFPPLKTADHPNNLPTQLTSFIGRDAEVAEVRHLLSETRLLTMYGAGGVGKTRLALQVASEELANFRDGVWFVELAPLADPALIPNTVASAVGVREEPNRPILGTLSDHFRAKTALLVLDNCEHLLADAAQVCDTLLHAAPRLKIVATSREALGIAGETAYRVSSLGIPSDTLPLDELSHVASVQLFAERAKSAKTDFTLTDANAPAVAQICRRLDGIPLAIELAAARIKALAPEQIAARLDDRFRLLTGGSRTALPRQQTLRAAIDWSHNLLPEAERILLRRLSVFAGGWMLEAAEVVCAEDGLAAGDILDLLTHLVDKSLLAVETTDDAVRYRMLETVRQYAREKLLESGETESVRNRHLDFFVAFGEGFRDVSAESEQANIRRFQRLGMELDNLRAALTWAMNGRIIAGLRLISEVFPRLIWLGCGIEGYDWTMALLRLDNGPASGPRAKALMWAGSWKSHYLNNKTEGWPLLQQSISAFRTLGQKPDLSQALTWSAIALRAQSPSQAHAILDEALQLSQELNDVGLIARVHNARGGLWRHAGDDKQAELSFEQSLSCLKTLHSAIGISGVNSNLGFVMLHQHDHVRARRLFREGLRIAGKSGLPMLCAGHLAGIGGVAAVREQSLFAARLFGAARAILDRLGYPLEFEDAVDFDRYLALARSQSDPSAFEAAFAGGYAMSRDEAIAFALELNDA